MSSSPINSPVKTTSRHCPTLHARASSVSSNGGKSSVGSNGGKKMPPYQRQTSGTFAMQHALPRLPIPSLEETMDKLAKVLMALETNQQREETKKIIQEFQQGEGPKLHQLLQEYEEAGRADGTLGSYVEEFWNDSYLAPDQSVVLNLNPFFVLEDGPDPKIAKDPILRAASLTFASVKLASILRNEMLEPDTHRGKPLCMDQLRALFGASRVSEKGQRDEVAVYPYSSHICVMTRSQLYYFQVLWPDGTVAVDEADLVDILHAIQKNSKRTHVQEASKSCLGVLTSLPRQEWATARANMISSSPKNEEALEIIDSALFVLALDDFVPEDVHETAANMLHGTYKISEGDDGVDYQVGTCCNRWYDKLQIIVCNDGTAGINFEHSAIDGHTALRFVSDIFAETVVNFAQSITKGIHAQGRIPHVVNATVKRAALVLDDDGAPLLDVFPKKLVLKLPSSVKQQIYFAETALGDQIVASDTVVLEFRKYGKALIVANKISPDSFVQMMMLLAYYRLYGKIVCMYEPVLTKQFYHGRTEAMRTATPAAAEFCEVWCSAYTTPEQKLESLRKATKEHSRLVKESANGKGVDRHLFALRCIAERNDMPLPAFFQSRPWNLLNHTILSTSNCGNPSLRLFGFGPVVQDGFGIGYIIKGHGLHFSVSSKHRQTRRYVHTLETTLLEMKKLFHPINTVHVEDLALDARKSLLEVPSSPINNYGGLWGEEVNNSVKNLPPTPDLQGPGSYFAPLVKRGSLVRQISKVGIPVDIKSDSPLGTPPAPTTRKEA